MLNMQLDKAVTINTAEMEWEASPMAGVWRKPLAREAAEHGHTTSVVRYDANSHFSSHPHPKGEEILVLDGVFSDEQGDYPAGTYIRNPPGSSHSPFSEKGCELLAGGRHQPAHRHQLQRLASRRKLGQGDAAALLRNRNGGALQVARGRALRAAFAFRR
jgi:anti-sigma factor ChrR (cupin superfamily)